MIIPFRAESLLSVAEFIKVKRSTDDEPDDNAADAAANLEQLSITRDGERVASKVRFDLDLPSAAEDDVVLGDGIPLPEWDYDGMDVDPNEDGGDGVQSTPLVIPVPFHGGGSR